MTNKIQLFEEKQVRSTWVEAEEKIPQEKEAVLKKYL